MEAKLLFSKNYEGFNAELAQHLDRGWELLNHGVGSFNMASEARAYFWAMVRREKRWWRRK
jgi:hypothetical protein